MKKSENKAKSLKLGGNDIICPSCNQILNVSNEIKNEELIQCNKCEAAIKNPLFFSGKFVLCQNCGNDAELPKEIENELTISCSNCKEDIYNPHSKEYNPMNCPHCNFNAHLTDDVKYLTELICPNCEGEIINKPKKNEGTNCPNCGTFSFYGSHCSGKHCGNYIIIPKEKQTNIEDSKEIKRDTIKKTNQNNITKTQKNWLIGIAIVGFLWFIGTFSDNSSSTTTLYKVNTTTYVGTSKVNYDEMFDYLSTSDMQALSSLMMNGQVELLTPGTEVYLLNAHFGYAVVRLNGSTQKLWIVTEHISKE
jgi:DNA-directed RNA polymerase subunit RPC12/RpoP